MTKDIDFKKKPTIAPRDLNLQDSAKYQRILDESVDQYKNVLDEESETPVPIIHEPWSYKKIEVFGSLWFTMLIFLFIGNILMWAYYRGTAPEALTIQETDREWKNTYSMYTDDFEPFKKFLALSSEVTDSDYTSFLKALTDLNKYFPSERFDRTALFSESGFHFQGQGIYYNEVQ